MKIFENFFVFVFSFGLSRCLPIEETNRITGDPQCTLTIEYTFIRYNTWAGEKP